MEQQVKTLSSKIMEVLSPLSVRYFDKKEGVRWRNYHPNRQRELRTSCLKT